MKSLSLFFLLLLSLVAFAQTDDYIKTDTSREIGIDILQRSLKNNCETVEFWRGQELVRMQPTELDGYFIAPDNFYTSGWVTLEDTVFKAFAREINRSEGLLYEYRGDLGYYILKRAGDTLRKIPEEQLSSELANFFPNDEKAAQLAADVRYSDKDINDFFEDATEGDYSPPPQNHFAVEAGLNLTSFYSESFDTVFHSMPTDIGYGIGLRGIISPDEWPLDIMLGLFFTQYRIESDSSLNSLFKYRMSASQLEYSALLRYSRNAGRLRPYFAIGPRVTDLISASHLGQHRVTTDSVVQVDFFEAGYFTKTYFHLGTYLGVEVELASQNILYFETRYFYQLNRQAALLRRNDFQFVMGFSF